MKQDIHSYGLSKDSRVTQGGKGDKKRPINKKKFDENYDKIFKNKKSSDRNRDE